MGAQLNSMGHLLTVCTWMIKVDICCINNNIITVS